MRSSCWRRAMAAAVLATGTAGAEEQDLAVEMNVSALSAYASRGQINNDEPVVQPVLTVSKNGWAMEVWGNFNLTDRVSDEPDMTELDWTLFYTVSVKALEIEAGVIEYTFPNSTIDLDTDVPEGAEPGREAAPGTREAYVAVSVPDWIVTPKLEAYYDFDEADGFYFAASLAKDIEITDRVSLTPSFSSGYGTRDYNAYYFGVEESAWNDGVVGLSLDVTLTDSWAVGANINYMWLWEGDIRDVAAVEYLDDESLFGGVSITYTF
jgi:hypothetical protein